MKEAGFMQLQWRDGFVRTRRLMVLIPVLLAGIIAFRRAFLDVAGLVAGGAVTAFLIAPLAKLFERRLPRRIASAAALIAIVLLSGSVLWLTLPVVLRELQQLGQALPHSLEAVAAWTNALSAWAQARLPGIELPKFPLDSATAFLTDVIRQAMAAIGSLANGATRLSLMLILGCFFLCQRDALLLRLELLSPLGLRPKCVRAGRALARELRLYLQGQLLIAASVGVLAVAGLWLVGLQSALVLGAFVGVMNIIPYFGPFIGGVPAVVAALAGGWQAALMCAGMLILVQQIDSTLLSPRIMGSLIGLSPATVLIATYAGGSAAGIVGMLIALPVLMSIRTVFRVFVQNYENI